MLERFLGEREPLCQHYMEAGRREEEASLAWGVVLGSGRLG